MLAHAPSASAFTRRGTAAAPLASRRISSSVNTAPAAAAAAATATGSPAAAAAAAARRRRPLCPRAPAAHGASIGPGPSSAPLPPGAAAASPTPPAPVRLAVFVSGGGSNFRAVHAAILDGRIGAGGPGSVLVSAVVTDVPSCGGAAYAREHGIPVLTYPRPRSGAFEGLTPSELADALRPDGAGQTASDVALLAGYLKLVPPEAVRLFPRRMLNIHPALLPAFGGKGLYGERVHRAVIASGARFSGPTVHFVDEEYDTGPILAQRCVPVFPDDTPQRLARRVLREEHLAYPEAVAALVEGRVTWRDDGVPVVWSAH